LIGQSVQRLGNLGIGLTGIAANRASVPIHVAKCAPAAAPTKNFF
jgi:hypothetical protein